MPITPPVFVRTDDFPIYGSVADAQLDIEPVDVSPEDRAYDAEGRALAIRVRGEVKKHWFVRDRLGVIDQSGARVEITLAEEDPTHGEELRAELVGWLTQVEDAPADGTLAELVERARKYVHR